MHFIKKSIVIILAVLACLVVFKYWYTNHHIEPKVVADGTLTEETMQYDGEERDFITFVPTNVQENPPLVFVLHGGYGWPENMRNNTNYQFEKIAEEEGFIIIYPAGTRELKKRGGHWNDGRDNADYQAVIKNTDDVGFISMLIDSFAETYNADTSRVYVTGLSNGGGMAYRLACELSDKITAIAPVVGPFAKETAKLCSPVRPVPVYMIYGYDDPLVRFDTRYVHAPGGKTELGEKLTIPETINQWVTMNDCGGRVDETNLPDRADDGTYITRTTYNGCANGTQVVADVVYGGGHTWPQGNSTGGEFLVGKESQDMNAGEEIWNFFKQFSL